LPALQPRDDDKKFLKLLASLVDPRPAVSDAYWSATHPVDRIMGRGRAEGGQMMFPFGGIKAPRYEATTTPWSITVKELNTGAKARFDRRNGKQLDGPPDFGGHMDNLPRAPRAEWEEKAAKRGGYELKPPKPYGVRRGPRKRDDLGKPRGG
jgi:hypothetical protein